MNIFSFILIFIIIYIEVSIKEKIKKFSLYFSLTIFFELLVNVGYFINIGDFEIFYSDVLVLILFIYSLSYLIVEKIPSKIYLTLFIVVIIMLLTNINLIINPYQGLILRNKEYITPAFSTYTLFLSIRYLLFAIILIIFSVNIKEKEIYFISRMLKKMFTIFLIFLVIEFFTKNVFGSLFVNNIVKLIFGYSGGQVDFLLSRGGIYTIQGLNREPGHLADGIFYLYTLILFTSKKIQLRNTLFALIIILLILSGSFTSFLYIIPLIIFQFFHLTNKEKLKFATSIFVLSVLFILFFLQSNIFAYYFDRLLNVITVIFGNDEIYYSSEAFRIQQIQNNIDIFKLRPLLGHGIGIPYAYSFISGVLPSIGILGTFSWIALLHTTLNRKSDICKKIIIFTIFIFIWILKGGISYMYSVFMIYLIYSINNLEGSENHV